MTDYLDRIKGALFLHAIGDALGVATQFMKREEIQDMYGEVTEMMGDAHRKVGKYKGLPVFTPGEGSDDTEMTLCVARGILEHPNDPIYQIGNEFLRWNESHPKNMGLIVRLAIRNYNGDWMVAAKTAHEFLEGMSAGNGSLMRCLPIALAYSDRSVIRALSSAQSHLTHYDPLASEACVLYNLIVADVLDGDQLHSAILTHIRGTRYETLVDIEDVPSDGYVVHTMKWVLHLLMTSTEAQDVVIRAVNLGGDTDTIAAIAGGLAGAYWGFDAIPERWVSSLMAGEELSSISNRIWNLRMQGVK